MGYDSHSGPTDGTDVGALIARAPMRRGQIVAVMICILLNALDGFDVLSISFASPGIAAQWRVDRAALGVVLSMELIGMAGGSILLGTLCDRWGRRPTILTCLLVMGIGMSLASVANSIASLSLFRLFTGVGIGGMLAATNAATAEFANARHRDLAVALMAAGYPFGAVVGGSMASVLLVTHSWRSIFVLGATASFVAIPFVLFLLPETVAFLGRRQQPDALQRVNRALRLLSHAPVERLSPPDPGALKGAPLRQLFSPTLRRTTFCLMLAYVAQILTFYFILKWTPKIVVDMGFAPSMAGTVLVWANIGGLAGSIALSLLTRVAPLRWLTLGSMILSTMLVALFGRSAPDLHQLALLAAIAGFCTNAGMVGLYALVAASFPSEARASGTGLVIGIGRGGAALSPVLAGLLFQAGVSLPTVALVMAFGSIIAAAAVFGMRPIRSR